MGLFGGGFDVSNTGENALPEEEMAVVDKLARWLVNKWGSAGTMMGILVGESMKPANYIGSQVLVFFEPIVQTLFNIKEYDTFRSALEKRQTLEILVRKIEEYDAIAQRREKAFKKWYKQEKKKWKWYQRYLGVFTPKYEVPEEILNPPESPRKEQPPPS